MFLKSKNLAHGETIGGRASCRQYGRSGVPYGGPRRSYSQSVSMIDQLNSSSEKNVFTNMFAQIGHFGRSCAHTVPNSTIEPSWVDRHTKRDVGDSVQVTGAMILTHS